MDGDPRLAWRITRLVRADGETALEWSAPGSGPVRTSPLPIGAGLSFTVGADRRCTGVWRAGRRIGCPTAAEPAPVARTAQCAGCTALDRSSSVASDTRLDDPRPFTVYLAHHGNAGIKVGITGAHRGTARLLEQGAFASMTLSTGTLPSARRTEHLLMTALGLPDRVSTPRKREARLAPGTPEERADTLLATAARAARLPWPEGQTWAPSGVTDSAAAYGLPPEGLRPVAAAGPFAPGDAVNGTVTCRIGADLYLETAAGQVLLDTRLLAGWALTRAESGAAFTAPLTRLAHREPDQEGLF